MTTSVSPISSPATTSRLVFISARAPLAALAAAVPVLEGPDGPPHRIAHRGPGTKAQLAADLRSVVDPEIVPPRPDDVAGQGGGTPAQPGRGFGQPRGQDLDAEGDADADPSDPELFGQRRRDLGPGVGPAVRDVVGLADAPDVRGGEDEGFDEVVDVDEARPRPLVADVGHDPFSEEADGPLQLLRARARARSAA